MLRIIIILLIQYRIIHKKGFFVEFMSKWCYYLNVIFSIYAGLWTIK